MVVLKQVVRGVALWAAANPVKAVQIAIAVGIIGVTLVQTRKLDTHTLKRAAKALF